MATMLKIESETELLPEEIFAQLSRIGMQFVDVINEEVYGEEKDDDDELTEDEQAKLENTMKMIVDKHRGGTSDGASPNSNHPQLN